MSKQYPDKKGNKHSEKKPYRKEGGEKKYDKPGTDDRKRRDDFDKSDRKSYGKRDGKSRPDREDRKRRDDSGKSERRPYGNKSNDRKFEKPYRDNRKRRDDFRGSDDKPYKPHWVEEVVDVKPEAMPLNKYIAHCGVCSRREAATLVKEGKIKVNGKVAEDPGYKIQPNDKVSYKGKELSYQKDLVYVLLNKPKNYITTTDDPKQRRTVMELVKGVRAERIYPVGRLDRNTTGLLLLTNDGELAQKLSHPKHNIKKVYKVTTDKPVTEEHFEKIVAGLELEDGKIKVDALAYLEKKNELGIELHSGRNRIVRRIFEHFGYVVDKLDRVMYAGLTKKNIPRGKWRTLSPKEVIMLKHFNR